jgi:hypothetical protein
MLNAFVGRLFGFAANAPAYITPGLRLSEPATRSDLAARLTAGERVFIYFNKTLGGELSIPGTDASPEFSFDVTVFEVVLRDGHPNLDRFGVIEVQTMDFHGSYKHAVQNLRDGLRLHGADFAKQLQGKQEWLSEHIEGPNIANVFKRTFYQMMFKFQLGQHPRCAGCVLAIPVSVWNSWGPHLGNPALTPHGDGTDDLFAPGSARPVHVPAWIYVFGLDADDAATPSPLIAKNIIATDAPTMGYYALSVAPANSLASIGSEAGMLALACRRITALWPELGVTLTAEPAPGTPAV